MINQRDLVLVPFPFSDQSGRKVRPVIVISNDKFNDSSEDLLVVGVTSNISKGQYTLELGNVDLEDGNLFTKCCIKVENILKLDKDLVIKKIGKINKDKLTKLIDIFMKIVN